METELLKRYKVNENKIKKLKKKIARLFFKKNRLLEENKHINIVLDSIGGKKYE